MMNPAERADHERGPALNEVVDHNSQVGAALPLLIEGLAPFVESTFADVLPAEVRWPEVLQRKDTLAGRRGPGVYRDRDLSLLLRAMTERLGELGYPFSRALSRQGQSYASELRQVRNDWAHNEPFSAAAAYRALDSAELLLREIGARDQADAIADAKSGLLPGASAVDTVPAPLAPAAEPGGLSRLGLGTTAGPRMSVSALPVLSYAMAHCRVLVIDEITVAHEGPDVRGATIEVDVVCASGSLGGPKVLMLDLAEGQTTTLRQIDLVLDPARMLAVETQQPGRVVTTLRDPSGSTLASVASDVTVLAAPQWVAQPAHLGMEMLAAHVQPNSAAIPPLILEASDLLRKQGREPSLDGYQAGDPDRVDAVVRCVFEATAARDIRYAEPPASWGEQGQKVRTPHEVVEGRLGTCLDTTVTMAAALEHVGINTTLWLLRGHSFLGYWRIDSSLAAVTSVEVDELVNLVDLGHLGLVETTMLTGGPDAASFDDATRAARARLDRDASEVLGVTDVRQARRSRILPLPSRSLGADGQVLVSVYEAGAGPEIAAYQATPHEPAAGGRLVEPPRVSRWKNALLDLSLRNRLIHYTDRAGFHLDVPPGAIHRLEDQISAQVPITLLPADSVSSIDAARGIAYGRDLPERDRELLLADKRSAFIDITAASYTTKLRYLAYKARTIVEETGSNNLYLAFGMLRWHLADRDLRSPLVLVPVTLTTTSRGESYRIALDDAGGSTPNYCLLEKLRLSFGLEVPQLQDPAEDASGIDLAGAFDALRAALLDAGLPFRVEDTVELAILQFAKFPLWKDLDEHWQTLSTNPLVRHLIETPMEPFTDPIAPGAAADLDELSAQVPVPADSSQLEAVHVAVQGQTFVLEGPPGTGKSQTITNLLARALASGQRVLFVAEKRAALDVVKKRLSEVGLADLALDLHDKSARPASVRSQIQSALGLQVRADQDLLNANREAVEADRRRLALYAERLHQPNGVGHSLYSARAFDLAADRSIPPMDIPSALVSSATVDHVAQLRAALRRVPEYADIARPSPHHPWRFVERCGTPSEIEAISAAAHQLDEALGQLQAAGGSVDWLQSAQTDSDVLTWARLALAPRHPLDAVDVLHEPVWRHHLDELTDELATLASDASGWRAVVSPEVMLRDVPALHQGALAADASGFFGRKRRRRAVLDQFADLLLVPAAQVNLKSLSHVTGDMTATAQRVNAVRTTIGQIPIPLVPAGWNPADPAQAGQAQSSTGWLIWSGDVLCGDRTALREAYRDYYSTTPAGAFGRELAAIATAWTTLVRTGVVDPQQAGIWAAPSGFLPAWWNSRAQRNASSAVSLQRWMDLLLAIEPLRVQGLAKARTALLDGALPPDDAVIAFDRGLALASIEERNEATGLGDFEIAAQNRTISRFTAASRAVRGELPRLLPQQIVESRRFNSAAITGQMGGLRRQLQRQRGGMSVRGLLENYGELITQILPCTLMSPQSVARFFPARADLFDIVVFDEASQIRVSDAVGAMGRARSVVVVGDSKQMPPSQFGETSATAEDDEQYQAEVVLDEESILTECVQARVPSRWLSWHYRSQDESLIAFSNQHYYENRLSSFPAPLTRDAGHHRDGYGISLVRVNGTFERGTRGRTLRTNRVEAEAILQDVRQRFWASPDRAPSLGIITFNAQQRDLIENLLRDCDDDRLAQALDQPDGLFVKNLENVQGDERDTILFSVAFSANDKGVVPLNFGPLSRPGGERRLNVAVTRARRQVVLYASFDPGQLRAEETTQTGTKHLKAYLELAARGTESMHDDTQRRTLADRHRDDIAEELRAVGYTVTTDVGLSDFRIDIVVDHPEHPGQPLLAVLLDGENWRARRTVADRDSLPIDVLKDLMHWPGVERVWLPEWMQDRSGTIDRLAHAISEAKAGRLATDSEANSAATSQQHPPPTPQPTPPPAAAVALGDALPPFRDQPGSPPAPVRSSLIQDYVEFQPSPQGDRSVLDALPGKRASSRVARSATAAIDAEGPIQRDRLARLTAAAFGLSRVNDERKHAIWQALKAEGHKPDAEGFYWPAGLKPHEWPYARVPGTGRSRPLEEISLVEIANAMRIVAEQSAGLDAEEITRDTLNLFGGRRRTESVRDRLTSALATAVQRGVLEQHPDGYYRPSTR